MTCKPDPAQPGQGPPRKDGEPDGNETSGCERYRSSNDEIALNCEMGLYREFQMVNGVITGCKGLEHFGEEMASDAQKPVWSKIDGRDVEPECPKQSLQEPAGSKPLYMDMEEFAHDQTAWIDAYIPTMEKMMRNGYESLQDSVELGEIDCPIPKSLTGDAAEIEPCFVKSEPDDGPEFLIGNRQPGLNNKFYQYNPKTGEFDFAKSNGKINQVWKLSKSGSQFINMMTKKPLVVDNSVEWTFETEGESFKMKSLDSGLYNDCIRAAKGKPAPACANNRKINKPQQLFYRLEITKF
eukprot:TRINITY_DN32692_c0_g1_i1.p1 TRINITY_DN32692_c0_g1~~TRINITY_DN32692_c0_g1_i1.p1  ORF type:complete len:314 (+),score=67.51 TRINITY_DN32692_c0_g1_i1:57-944(+)